MPTKEKSTNTLVEEMIRRAGGCLRCNNVNPKSFGITKKELNVYTAKCKSCGEERTFRTFVNSLS